MTTIMQKRVNSVVYSARLAKATTIIIRVHFSLETVRFQTETNYYKMAYLSPK